MPTEQKQVINELAQIGKKAYLFDHIMAQMSDLLSAYVADYGGVAYLSDVDKWVFWYLGTPRRFANFGDMFAFILLNCKLKGADENLTPQAIDATLIDKH